MTTMRQRKRRRPRRGAHRQSWGPDDKLHALAHHFETSPRFGVQAGLAAARLAIAISGRPA